MQLETRIGSLAVVDHGGAGHPVVLLHGLARTSADWDLVAPTLAAHHRVVAVDLPGHGRSYASDAWSWVESVEAVRVVVSTLGGRAAVVGHSLGGLLAAACARHPWCTAAVDVDGHSMGDESLYVGLPAAEVRRRRELARAAAPAEMPPLDVLGPAMVQQAIDLGASRELAERMWARSVVDGEVRPSLRLQSAVTSAVDDLDVGGLFEAARCPVLVVEAARPPDLTGAPDWWGELLAAYRAGLQPWLDEQPVEVARMDATHALLIEDPGTLAELLLAFLRD